MPPAALFCAPLRIRFTPAHTNCSSRKIITGSANRNDAAHLRRVASRVKIREAPHSASHFVRRTRRADGAPFFEGWYLRLVLPETDASFAFMFSVEAQGLGTVQVAGPDDSVHFHALSGGLTGFRASPRALRMRHYDHVDDYGYELTDRASTGRLPNGLSWYVRYAPLATWGDRGGVPRCTATRLSRFAAFEPGWQVLMAHGVALHGTVRYSGKVFDVRDARVYIEKNWGASFPSKWWWVQANAFSSHPDLSVTAVGATRMVLGWKETLGMIAVHLDGVLYEFANWNSTMSWNVRWGAWEARCTSSRGYEAVVRAETAESGVVILGPTANGMSENVRDAMHGAIRLTLRAPDSTLLLDGVQCPTAQVETGGSWNSAESWVVDVQKMPQPLRGVVNFFDARCATTT